MEQRNLIVAFVLSLAVLLAWSALFPQKGQAPVQQQDKQPVSEQQAVPDMSPDKKAVELKPPPIHPARPAPTVKKVAAAGKGKTIEIFNDLIRIGIDSHGHLTKATLLTYREGLEANADNVSVLHVGESRALFINSGILEEGNTPTFKLVSSTTDSGASKVSLRSRLSDGRVWWRHFTLKSGSYVLEIEDRIENGAGLQMYRQVVERYPDKEASTFIEHVGPIGLMNDKLKEPEYEEIDKDTVTISTNGGWTGIMSRYFIAAVIGDPARPYRYYYKGDGRSYQAGLLDAGIVENKAAVFRARVYIGPKSIAVMQTLGAGLERSVDFGWFSFIAKPLHDLLLWFYKFISNYGWCIILLVVLIKLLFFWPSQKSYESMAAMRKLQPDVQRLKELYGDDRQKMGQEMMALYKKHKVNPLGGCLPIVIQIPVFFALYKVLLMSIEMRQEPFIGWIHDLSAQDPYFVLPILMGLSMLIQQRLNPQPPDPVQAKVMKMLPIVFTALFLFFPAGLVLYWFVNNVLSILQQWYVMKAKRAV